MHRFRVFFCTEVHGSRHLSDRLGRGASEVELGWMPSGKLLLFAAARGGKGGGVPSAGDQNKRGSQICSIAIGV